LRGKKDTQSHIFSYFSPEERVPTKHPLRQIKAYADEALKELSPVFDQMYSNVGRPSIPPERLLKSMLLMALYSVRSDRLFCEMLDYNILYRWFLDMDLEEASFDASSFSKNRERLLNHRVSQRFFDAVVRLARREGLLSDEHFTVDGTLIEAWASLKSFQARDKKPGNPPDDPGNATVNFHGERRLNETHESTTDPQAKLMRKGRGKEAKLSFGAHALMDNRDGLCVDFTVTPSVGVTEPQAARGMLARQGRKRVKPKTLGADKNYHTKGFVKQLRERRIQPHIAQIRGRVTPGLDGRTTRHESYIISQRKRKRIEEIFGWLKTIGGLRKTRFIGVARVEHVAHIAATAYNLLRIAKLLGPAPG
jgi:transposase